MFRLKMKGKNYGIAPDWMEDTFKKQGFKTERKIPKGRKRIIGKSKIRNRRVLEV